MISPQEALDIILSTPGSFGMESVPILSSQDRFLAEDIVADRDFPPYDRVAMDGIAIKAGPIGSPLREYYTVQGIQPAGSPRLQLTDHHHCIEIMTGSVLSSGADSVIPYEEVDIRDGRAYVSAGHINRRNIHYKGKDHKEGQAALSSGKRISSSDIGVLATTGINPVPVYKLPRVALLSTGDELVDIDQNPLAHQVRKSNIYTLAASLAADNIHPDTFHINDDQTEVDETISGLLDRYDVVMMSGGVSMGKYDLIPSTLEKLGVKKLFHKVAQKPGKPFWFGYHKDHATHVFAYPGNPVSTFVCHNYYFRQWLFHSCGNPLILPKKVLSTPFPGMAGKAFFMTVTLDKETGMAGPVSNSGSGDLFSLRHADGFLLLPKRGGEYEAGQSFPFIRIL